MANRNVFKFLGSLGPGGTIGVLCEKIFHQMFYDAYEQGDPNREPAEEYKQRARDLRTTFVEELFEVRGRLEREMESFSEDTRESAYKELVEIIKKHQGAIARAEQSRLARERLFYKPNTQQYKRLLESARNVTTDTCDNLIKMALHIVKKADKRKLVEHFGAAGQMIMNDTEQGSIQERVTRKRAEELHLEWKRILLAHEKEGNDIEHLFACQSESSNQERLIETSAAGNHVSHSDELEALKDKLFVVTGEDQFDTWAAFEYYHLDPKLTSQDRSRLAIN